MPMMNLPFVHLLSVPPLSANAVGVRHMTGETAMPVVKPSGTTSRVASQRCAHV